MPDTDVTAPRRTRNKIVSKKSKCVGSHVMMIDQMVGNDENTYQDLLEETEKLKQ